MLIQLHHRLLATSTKLGLEKLCAANFSEYAFVLIEINYFKLNTQHGSEKCPLTTITKSVNCLGS